MHKGPVDERAEPTRIANRYDIQGVLGRGGMACVYLATDTQTDRKVALKEMILGPNQDRASVTALFEREFHTLAQLAHPRVIAVYDYGISTRGPYYTMELLDGGDLRDRTPVPWRQACALFFDVCSSLALLHSRRLLHRDISPRNIRCTRDDKAKLIDFGAMTSMGSGGAQVVGTPAFVAPETVHRLALDARADLFSLGATLFNALTGHMPYPARTFAEALSAWNTKPVPPSARVPGIPPALDDLVLSMISIEPTLRPKTAFDVMQRLAAIADLPRDESVEVAAAYLSTPTLVGREREISRIREHLAAALVSRGGGVLIRSATGVGRTRVLDASAIEAQTLGATALRATATGDTEPFSLTKRLFEQLGAAESWETVVGDSTGADRIQQAVSRFILTASRTQPFVLAVDDVHRADAASASVLAALIDKAPRGNVSVVMTSDSSEASNLAVDVLSRRCTLYDLEPLSREHTNTILSSVFGDVQNLELLTDEIYKVARGNPGLSMELAQHLVDHELIRYVAGTWALPDRLSPADLPRSAEDALRAKLGQLSAAARCMAEAQSVAYNDLFTDAEYRALLPDADPRVADHAVSELLALGVISQAGHAYTLSNSLWASTLRAAMSPETSRARNLALAEMYRATSPLGRIYHLFAAGADRDGLRALTDRHREYLKGFDPKIILDPNLPKLSSTYQKAIRVAPDHGTTPRELHDMRRWTVALSVSAEGSGFRAISPPWLAQLKRDSGLDLWQADTETADPMQRLMNALQGAQNRYLATPESERVYTVEEAIRLLAEYVVIGIAIGAGEIDVALLQSLPPLLEPFVPLAPALEAIWQNALATAESQHDCRWESAHARWAGVLQKLDALSSKDVEHIDAIRAAVAFALGMIEVQLGVSSAMSHATRLDDDPMQKLSAVQLRKIVRLQQGDWAGAERLRREGEVLSLQFASAQMFRVLSSIELTMYERAGDLTAMQQAVEKMRALGERFPTYKIFAADADAHFDLTRGDFTAAKQKFERCLAPLETPEGREDAFQAWLSLRTGLAGTLLGLEQFAQARACAAETLAECESRGVRLAAQELIRTLALADAKLGDYRAGAERLEALIRDQQAIGASGLLLGLSFEARARLAVWAADSAAFTEYSRLAAREYGRGVRSPLSARYEQLLNEALRSGFYNAPDLSEFEPSTMMESGSQSQAMSQWTAMTDLQTAVSRVMTGARKTEERADRALRLLCETRSATDGHLFVVTSAGLRLAASVGSDDAPANLRDLATEYLKQEQARADTMTEVVTGTLVAEANAGQTLVQCAGVTYEFLMLASISGGEGIVAGIAAIAQTDHGARYVKQAQLLATLAAHLIEGGDVTGMRFDVS